MVMRLESSLHRYNGAGIPVSTQPQPGNRKAQAMTLLTSRAAIQLSGDAVQDPGNIPEEDCAGKSFLTQVQTNRTHPGVSCTTCGPLQEQDSSLPVQRAGMLV